MASKRTKSRSAREYEQKIFVLKNIPVKYGESLVNDYVEGTLDLSVKEVIMHSYIPETALIVFEDTLDDVSAAVRNIKKAPLESRKLTLLRTFRENAVVISNIDLDKLSEEALRLYLENEFADGNEIVESRKAWPDLQVAVVKFFASCHEVVDKILEKKDHVALPLENYHITISPFYHNFHEMIGHAPEGKPSFQPASTNSYKKNNSKRSDSELGAREKSSDMEKKFEIPAKEDCELQRSFGRINTDEEEEEEEEKAFSDSGDEDAATADEGDMESTKPSKFLSANVKKKKRPAQRSEERSGNTRAGGTEGNRRKDRTHKPKNDHKDAGKNEGYSIPSEWGMRERGKTGRLDLKSGASEGSSKRGGHRKAYSKKSFRSYHSDESISDEEVLSVGKENAQCLPQTKHHRFPSRRGRRGARGSAFVLPGDRHQTYKANYLIRSASAEVLETESSMQAISEDEPVFRSSIREHPRHSWENILTEQIYPEQSVDFMKIKKEYEEALQLKEKQLKEMEEKLAQVNTKPGICQEKVQITEYQAELLPHCFGSFDDCSVVFDKAENVAVLKGSKEKVRERELELLKELKTVEEELLALTPATRSVLTSDKGRIYLKTLLDSELRDVKVFILTESVIIAAKGKETLTTGANTLMQRLNYKETITLKARIPLDKLVDLQAKLEHALLVKVSWSECTTEIYVEGIRDDVLNSRKDVEHLAEDVGIFEKVFQVSGSHAKYLSRFLEAKVRALLKHVNIIDFTSTSAEFSVKFNGNKPETGQAERDLHDIKDALKTKTVTLKTEFVEAEDVMLISKGFRTKEMKDKIDSFEEKQKCIVVANFPSCRDRSFKPSRMAHPPSASQRSRSRSQSPARLVAQRSQQQKLNFSVTPACQLVIKPYGDIIKEGSDILVCVLDKSNMDLRKTKVGQTFNISCPSLWKQLQAQQANNPTAPVLTTQGSFSPLRCQAICHVILSPWDSCSSPAQLATAVNSVLVFAASSGVRTISFPVLGCGRLFKFPAASVAKTVLSCITASIVGTALQEIVLLAPDAELFREYQNAAPKYFIMVPDQSQGAVGGAPLSSLSATAGEADDGSDNDSEDSDGNSDSNNNRKTDLKIADASKQPETAEICMITSSGKQIDKMWLTLKKKITQYCLHTDTFNQSLASFWPRESRGRIVEEAKKLGVWVERSSHPKTKKPGYAIKGMKSNVMKMKDFIHQEFMEFSFYLPKQRIISDATPQRGTVKFMIYAAQSDEKYPSYWKYSESKSFFKKFKDSIVSQKDKNDFLVDVDSKTKDAITKLIAKTWDQQLIGHGADAAGLGGYASIKVVDVKRVENVSLFDGYRIQRKRLFEKMCAAGNICTDIGTLRGSKGRVNTTEALDDCMKKELYWEINEHYLFHGTKESYVEAVARNGIDPKVSSHMAMLGKGIYAAERATKADQYADSLKKRTRPGTELYMILARMLLGNVFLCNDKHKTIVDKKSEKLTRPPCRQCFEDKCGCKDQELFDSVMGNGKWMFREFVVYDKNQCYPEYIIKYKRV